MLHGDELSERVADSRRRARSLQEAVRLAAWASSEFESAWMPNEALLAAFAELAGRIAFDLAVVERDLALRRAA